MSPWSTVITDSGKQEVELHDAFSQTIKLLSCILNFNFFLLVIAELWLTEIFVDVRTDGGQR